MHVLRAASGLPSALPPQLSRTLRAGLRVAAASVLAFAVSQVTFAVGTPPAVGDVIFNEYTADNTPGGNDFVELLVLRDNVDLRGLRLSDNELLTPDGALNNNEMVIVFGSDAYLSDVPKGTTIAIHTTTADITVDTTVNPSASDWKMVLAPGTGLAIGVDGLGGSVNPGYANGGDAVYMYLTGPDGDSAGTDNVYLDFLSWKSDGSAVAPTGLTDINLSSGSADNAQYIGNTAAGNDVEGNWTVAASLGTETPGNQNAGQDLSGLRVVPVLTDLVISPSDAPDPVLVGNTLVYTIQVSVAGADATGIDAKFPLPPGVLFQGTTGASGFTGSQTGGVVTFSGGTLTAGSSATLTVDVVPLSAGVLTSGPATVDPSNTIAEANEGNNVAAAATTTVQSVFDNTPTISAGAPLSGVISDPTNPGVEVTVADAETAADDLTVTATDTTNAAVAPLVNVTVSGTGSTRTVTVNPAGVGYADITLTVSDGGENSASTVLKYAASAASPTPITSRFHTGASDASTAIGDTVWYVDGTISKDLLEPNFQKFQSDLITLGDVSAPEGTPPNGSIPVVGDVIFNEYQSDNSPGSNDFFELLVLRDNLDLRGLRVTDNELSGDVLNTNESVYVFASDPFLANVPRGTLIAVWTLSAGITTDTTVNPAVSDWEMVLAPGTGVAMLTDGLGGSLNLGLATGGDALYLYLPGPDGTSAGTDNVYLDFVSWEGGAVGPPGLVSLDLAAQADNSYYTGNTAVGNDFATNWVRLEALGSQSPGEPNPTQDLSELRHGGEIGASVVVTESGGTTAVVEGGGADSYTIELSTIPVGVVQVQATANAQTEVSLDGVAFGPAVTVVLTNASPVPVFVRAIDDAVVEPTTTVSVTHSISSSGDPAYSDALTPVPEVPVTVTDNEVLVSAIHDIQGPGSLSPMAGATVTTRGIVFALKSNGFFIQEPDAGVDSDPATSEGIFVFTSSAPTVTRGDYVQVSATVSEFVPSADPNQPPLTELSFATISVLSSGNMLPTATVITAAMTSAPNAIELLERLEGMRISVPSLTVVAPTQGFISEPNATGGSNGVFYGVVTGVARPFREAGIEVNDPLPGGAPCCVPRFDGNPERIRVDSDGQAGALTLDLTTGVNVTGMVGPLDYGFRTYTVLPDAGTATPATPNIAAAPVPAPSADEITVVGFNVYHFYDTVDDPGGEPVLTAAAFENRLKKASLAFRNILRVPDVVGVIEMENLSTLQTLAARLNADVVAAGGVNPNYTAHLIEGNDIGGIDVGFLVKSSRITVLSVTQEGDAETFVDPTDGSLDLLNDRPPLVLTARAIRPNGSVFDFVVIINHLRSLNGVDDAADGPRVRAKRRAQAEYLANLIQGMQAANPSVRVVAIGDFNAFDVNDGYVDGMGTIRGTPTPADAVVLASPDLVNPNLTNLLSLLPADERYSYSFDGNAQVLDHSLVTAGALSWVSRFTYARLDADYPETTRSDPNRPERLSDHDASVTYLALGAPKLAGSIIAQTPRAGGQITVTLRVSNTGGGNAGNVALNQVVLKTLSGSGTGTNATPLPIELGDIAAGQFRTVEITLNVPATVARFSMTETGTYSDAGATSYNLSMGQAVVP